MQQKYPLDHLSFYNKHTDFFVRVLDKITKLYLLPILQYVSTKQALKSIILITLLVLVQQ